MPEAKYDGPSMTDLVMAMRRLFQENPEILFSDMAWPSDYDFPLGLAKDPDNLVHRPGIPVPQAPVMRNPGEVTLKKENYRL